jgi:hypothetical protein
MGPIVKYRMPRRGFVGFMAWPLVSLVLAASAQTPGGALTGVVTDPTGALVAHARITITHQSTGQQRQSETAAEGRYVAPALPAGTYTVQVEAAGFQTLTRIAIVETGSTTTLDLSLPVAAAGEVLEVRAGTPQIRRDAYDVSHVVTRDQIEGLPLNGRSVLELAKLEPGAQSPTYASNNRTFVPLLGSPIGQNGRATRITVDGGSIMMIGNGGSALGLSQEVVQEFQVSSANLDLSTGTTTSGAVNIVTRSGGNQLHGDAFVYLRDHILSAYPGLRRSAFTPDPFFQRRQGGFVLGGPLRKDRAFYFASFERTEQRGVLFTEILTPEFASWRTQATSPRYVDQVTGRVDTRLGRAHTFFLHFSHEGVSTFSTTTLNVSARAHPSAWTRQPAWADQSLLGLTSLLRPGLVNDLRFSYFFISSRESPARPVDCGNCPAAGAPTINVNPDLFLGNSTTAAVLGRRFHLHDVLSWSRGKHRVRFGGDYEVSRGGRTDTGNEPVSMTLYSPEQVRAYNQLPTTPVNLRIPLPPSFTRLEDILQLPVQSILIGIGDPVVPQKDHGHTRVQPLVHLFFQDAWQVHPRLTVNFGLGWTFDAPLNYDLARPAYLAPLFGAGQLGRRAHDWNNLGPAAGFAYSPGDDGKTVIRGGFGIYYDFNTSFGSTDAERVSLSPRGTSRGTYRNSGIRNPVSLPGLPAGTALTLLSRTPTLFTGAVLMQYLAAIRAGLEQQRSTPSSQQPEATNIEADKQGSLLALEFPNPTGTHFSLGVQREIARDLVVSADFVVRRFTHLPTRIDRNRFFSAGGPVLRVCLAVERDDPGARCSTGPIDVFTPIGRAEYRGLLVRAEKRLSERLQFLASYAYSRNSGHMFSNGFDNDHPLANSGPLDRDVPHLLIFSVSSQLPLGLRLGALASYASAPPFSAFLGGLDLNGDGTTGDLLPGTRANAFQRGMSKTDLRRLVEVFNRSYAGRTDALGRPIPTVTLPATFAFGDSLFTLDLRLSRSFAAGKRLRILLIGEAFNLFNTANLSGYSGDLLSAGFGQPTGRVTQAFGSGGPRSFQLATRLSF